MVNPCNTGGWWVLSCHQPRDNIRVPFQEASGSPKPCAYAVPKITWKGELQITWELIFICFGQDIPIIVFVPQPCFRCTLLILKRSHSVMLVTSSHFWSLVPNNTFLSQDADCVESRVRQFQCRCPRQVLQRIPTGETSDEVFLGWLVARDAFPKNYGNPTKHKEGDHIELLASCIYVYIYMIYIYHVLVGILYFEIPLGEYESWVNNNMFRHNLLLYTYWIFMI